MKKALSIAAVSVMAMNAISVPVLAEELPSQKEGIENTKLAVQDQSMTAKVSKLTAYGTEFAAAYDEAYRMPNKNVKKITNNGGSYPGTKLEYMLDDNPNTHWETTKNNSATFTNELVFEFKEEVVLDKIGFLARSINQKGFPEEFEIYASETGAEDTFQLVSSGSAVKTSEFVQFKFEPTKFKYLKFKFKKAYIEDRPFAAEFRFYKEDKVQNKMEKLFVDGTMSEVAAEFNTIEKINAFEEEVKSHPLYTTYKEDLELAKKIVKGEVDLTKSKFITVEQVGDRKAYAANELRSDIGSEFQPTGLAVKAGKTITVYVEPDGATKLPTIMFTQTEGAWSNWNRSVQLSPGKNVITVPTVPKDGNFGYDVTKGGTIYLTNPYTEEQQGGTPIIRIEGADFVPYMTKDTDPAEFKKFLTEYKAKIDADKEKNPKVADREVLDVVEMVSDHVIYTGTATEAYKAYITQNKDPKATVDSYDIWMHQIFDFHGLDKNNTQFTTDNIRESIRLMQPWGFMYAAWNHTGIQRGSEGLMFGDFTVNYPGWGLNHELGHRIDLTAREYGEVTNNMTSMGMSVKSGNMDNRIPYENIYKYVIGENKVQMANQDLAARLGAFWQLEMAHNGYWAELENLYRINKVANGNETVKQQNLIKYSSDVLKKDLSSHFARHGFTVTEETKAYTAQYEEPKKLWYLNNSVISYKGEGFTKGASIDVNVTVNEANSTNTLKFAIDEGNTGNVLGYEVYQDDVLIGFTATNSFTVNGVDVTKNYKYKVIAYDKKLNELAPVEVKAFTPTLSAPEQLTLKLNQEFNAFDYIKAYDYKGNDITSTVNVKSSDVKLNEKGNYQVVYEVTDQGITVTKALDVKVISDFDYLSDLKEKSHRIEWGGLKLDKAPQGSTITLLHDGKDVTYKKGIGAHANSEVVYGVAGKGYDNFESYIGIDQAMKDGPSSATFEVWVDNEKVYTSERFTSQTEAQYVNIPITGAKEVKLVTTDAKHNGNTSDHTVWADAKFTKGSSKPVISAKSVTTKAGQPIDVEYKATDVEDGDLTKAVKVEGLDTIDFYTAGDYTITYTVVDSDGNEVTEYSTVSVVGYEYLSDLQAKSHDIAWGGLQLDKSPQGGTITLLRDGKNVTYKKGIGAHANSEVVYDVADKGYDNFESYIGIDQAMKDRPSSATFEVWVDNKKVYTSETFTAQTNGEYIKIPIKGAKEVKLVTTDAKQNGNASDHTVWADAKFTIDSVNPVISVESVTTKVGQPIKIEYKATDVKDGNITDTVKVEGLDKIDFYSAGEYKISYTVTDSDGNEVTEYSTVSVIDYEYLSDLTAKSHDIAWGGLQLDKAPQGSTITLLRDGIDFTYTKGIGAHANSEVVYDVTGKGYNYFESYIGIDQAMKGGPSSATFEVWVDNNQVYTSKLFTAQTNEEYIKIPIPADAKEVKLVTTDAKNSNASDHTVWADAKFKIASRNPVVSINTTNLN